MPVIAQVPTADVAATFSPGLGTNYTFVADTSDLTYVYSLYDPGIEDRLTFPALPADAASITSVYFLLRISAPSDTFTCRVKLWLGGNTGVGPTRTTTPTITSYIGANLSRPGGGAWTVSDVNSTDCGYELVSGSAFSEARIYRIVRFVDYESSTPAPTRVAETVLLPADSGREVTVSGTAVTDLPADGNRDAILPTAAALDIGDGFATQPAVELEEEGI